ncbi:MAG TPA: aspartyl/asparaginyl beta-hydroxylase domain-containing protein [Woeseiaceae bacterium]
MASQQQPAEMLLVRQAEQAVRQGHNATALELLRRAEAIAPENVSVHLYKSLAHRSSGDFAAALAAVERALILDPYNFLARLSRGWLLDRMGRSAKAVSVYREALAIAPADDELPPDLRTAVARARELVTKDNAALKAHLEERVRELRSRFAGDPGMTRFDESVAILSGEAKAYVQQPLMLHYPRLPAIPFFERELFPWLPELEAATPVIVEEVQALLEQAGTEPFAPYIAYPPGSPLNQWQELNHSRRWSSFFLWHDGVRQDEACARCPRTAEILEGLPMARQERYAPTAMFSALDPRTTIPPHTGSINTRSIVHLPLVLPGNCRFRVGNVTREWRMNEAWVFDDTIEHEAWNDSDELRVILIFDVWNPLLTEAERELVTAMLAARAEFHRLRAEHDHP